MTNGSVQQHCYVNYLHLMNFLRHRFGVKPFGLGWTASRVDSEFDFMFRGVPFRFLPSASRSYCGLPAGIPNEPETHAFLATILDKQSDVLFIDVGASIGEFAVTMAHDSHVARVVAFEPQPETAHALEQSATRAPPGKLAIVRKAAGSYSGVVKFNKSPNAPTAARIVANDCGPSSINIDLCTLDHEIQFERIQPAILLIDVEGNELEVIKGGLKLIQGLNPVIIMEYNGVSKKRFHIGEVATVLRDHYTFYRLRSDDATLDLDVENAWNVVALPSSGPFQHLLSVPGLFGTERIRE
jgi:FkbM family methyltransferase